MRAEVEKDVGGGVGGFESPRVTERSSMAVATAGGVRCDGFTRSNY